MAINYVYYRNIQNYEFYDKLIEKYTDSTGLIGEFSKTDLYELGKFWGVEFKILEETNQHFYWKIIKDGKFYLLRWKGGYIQLRTVQNQIIKFKGNKHFHDYKYIEQDLELSAMKYKNLPSQTSGTPWQILLNDLGFGIDSNLLYMYINQPILSNTDLPIQRLYNTGDLIVPSEDITSNVQDIYNNIILGEFLNKIAKYNYPPHYLIQNGLMKTIVNDVNITSTNEQWEGNYTYSKPINYQNNKTSSNLKYFGTHPQIYPIVIYNDMNTLADHQLVKIKINNNLIEIVKNNNVKTIEFDPITDEIVWYKRDGINGLCIPTADMSLFNPHIEWYFKNNESSKPSNMFQLLQINKSPSFAYNIEGTPINSFKLINNNNVNFVFQSENYFQIQPFDKVEQLPNKHLYNTVISKENFHFQWKHSIKLIKSIDNFILSLGSNYIFEKHPDSSLSTATVDTSSNPWILYEDFYIQNFHTIKSNNAPIVLIKEESPMINDIFISPAPDAWTYIDLSDKINTIPGLFSNNVLYFSKQNYNFENNLWWMQTDFYDKFDYQPKNYKYNYKNKLTYRTGILPESYSNSPARFLQLRLKFTHNYFKERNIPFANTLIIWKNGKLLSKTEGENITPDPANPDPNKPHLDH